MTVIIRSYKYLVVYSSVIGAYVIEKFKNNYNLNLTRKP